MERSVKFYKDTLGLPLKSKSKDWTEFFKGDTVLALHPARKKSSIKTGSAMLVGFEVGDLDGAISDLRRRDVKFFKQPTDEPFGKHAIIKDPDGHLISIAEIKSKSTEGFDLIGFFGAE
jgi:catechol 2,3-dioxygenase-like lactoylglutathione lyase family enzyme